jgi:hypothetical protein
MLYCLALVALVKEKPMWTDPIVQELHQQRHAHAAQFDFDLSRLLLALHAAQDTQPSKTQAALKWPAQKTRTNTQEQQAQNRR